MFLQRCIYRRKYARKIKCLSFWDVFGVPKEFKELIMRNDRRDFLAKMAAGMALGIVAPSSVWAAGEKRGERQRPNIRS